MLPGFLGFGFVNLFRADGHVRQDGDLFRRDFNKALAHGEVNVLAVLAHGDFAGDQLRHERDMLGIDAHFAFDARQGDHFDIVGEGLGLRGDNFKFERVSHFSLL